MMTAKVKESIALRLLSTSSSKELCRGIPQFKAKVDAQTQLPDLIGPETWLLLQTINLDFSWVDLFPELCRGVTSKRETFCGNHQSNETCSLERDQVAS